MVPGLPPSSQLEFKRDIYHINGQTVVSLCHLLKRYGFSCKIWTEDMMLPQARRQKNYTPDDLALGKIYNRLRNPFWGILLRLVMLSPLRVILANDIFAIAWLPNSSAPPLMSKIPPAWTERLLTKVFNS